MKPGSTLPVGYFDDVYHNNEDPWDFEKSEYERRKFQATIDVLTRNNYANAFEIGCSIGVLTEKLAFKCTKLLAVDISSIPIENARKRLMNYPNVSFQKMIVPEEFPDGMFDLIIMSEVGYYLSMPDLEKARDLILQHLSPGGQLVLVHWTPVVHDYPLTGDQVHDFFLNISGDGQPLKVLYNKREEKYRINLFEKV